jgi:uncharacterized membrane protein (DUF485 family)
MDNYNQNHIEKKSLKERFLLVIGMLFFAVYVSMGLIILFWDQFPLRKTMPDGYRIALGVIIMVYAFLRFIRFFQKK